MPTPEKQLADFNEDGIYQVFNRTNNNERLFRNDENRHFFLKKYNEHLSNFLNTYAWCLLPDHFHFLVRIKKIAAIKATLGLDDFKTLSLTETRFVKDKVNTSELLEQSFKRLFQSYALSFNKRFSRNGNLFSKPFKRIEVNKDNYFTQAIVYIHANPQKHNLIKDFTVYRWSSYASMLSDAPTRILRKEVLDWFGGKEQFIRVHKETGDYYYGDRNFATED